MMERVIIAPPKIYLDTNHLIEIVRLRKGQACRDSASYATINRWLGNGTCTLIFGRSACLDWLAHPASLQSAQEIADVVDSAAVSLELEMDNLVYTQEVLEECKRLEPDILVPELTVLRQRSHDQPTLLVLARTVPEFAELFPQGCVQPNAEPRPTARQRVLELHGFKHRQPDVAGSYRDGFNEAQLKSQQSLANTSVKGYTRNSKMEWIARCLKVAPILRAYNPELDVDDLVSRIDPNRCPALSLWFSAYWHRNRAGHKPQQGDADDWAFVHVVPYADFVLAEKQLTVFLQRGNQALQRRVTSRPDEFVKMIGARLA